jgi:hypothetical protein
LGEPVGEQVVVELRESDGCVVQGTGIEAAPPPVRTLHLVRNHNMGMQVGIARAGVPMIEARGDRTPRSDLRYSAVPGAGEQRLPLEHADHVGDRGAVRRRDPGLQVRPGQRPQHAA